METIGLNRADLKPCAVCGKGLAHSGDVHFYRVTISQAVLNVNAVKRTHGLEMMMGGSAALADVFSPDHHLAQEIPSQPHNICGTCALDPECALPVLLEKFNDLS